MIEAGANRQKLFEGVGVAWALLFALFFLAFAVFDTWSDWGPYGPTSEWTNIPMLLLSFFGLTQAVYIVPCYFFFKRKNMVLTAKGLLWGALSIVAGNIVVYFLWVH